MSIQYLKKWIPLYIIMLSSCGLPDSSSFQEIQSPVIVRDSYPRCSVNSSGKITIELQIMVLNTENAISGYNTYVTTNPVSLASVKSTLNAQAQYHITNISGVNTFNKVVENNYIIKNSKKSFPTLTINNVPSSYNEKPTLTTVVLDHLPEAVFSAGAFNPNQSYGFAFTAISIPNTKESLISNVIIVTTGSKIGDPCAQIVSSYSTRIH